MTEKDQFTWPGRRPGYLPHDFILDYLGADIQRNPSAAAALVARVYAIEEGQESEWRQIGNLYQLHLTAERADIENIYDEESKGTAPFEDFAMAARAWLTFVSTG